MQEPNSTGNTKAETWEKVHQIRDKFEYDREMRMRDKGMLNVFMLDICFCEDLIS